MLITVVGDLLLDRDLAGSATRLCPDTPVPVVDVERSRARAGGAGLVARLLALDGHETTLVTALSDDRAAAELRRRLPGIALVEGALNAPTPVKTRVFASGQAVVRIDEGCAPPPAPDITAAMLSAIDDSEAIVVADYGRGLLARPELRAALRRRAKSVPVVWDPHPSGAPPVTGVAAATPNLAEALGRPDAEVDLDDIRRAATTLRQRWRIPAVVITLGARGAWVQEEEPEHGRLVPAPGIGEVDSCGAGDRFASALAVALSGKDDLVTAVAASVARTAAFLDGGGVGALPDTPAPQPPSLAPLGGIVERVRSDGGTIVATGGCFDLLHAGHLRTLRAARAQGDALVVCLNSDASVRRLKGAGRPLIGQQDRVELLRALECVDEVIVFDEDTPLRLLEQLRPDIWVKGGDYIAERLPEYALLGSWGGRCLTTPREPGRSTTALADALRRIA